MSKMNFKRPELCKHGGCSGCDKKCLFNSEVTTKKVADLTKGKLFNCNSERSNNEPTN